jgi:O-antigen ligase
VALLISLLIVLSTLAFGSVYAWGYLPLFISATCIGLGAIVRAGGVPRELRALSIGLGLVALAIAVQLIPLDGSLLAAVSPQTPAILGRYVVGFATSSRHALSVDAAATAKGLGAALALSVYAIGVSSLLSRRRTRFLGQSLIVFGVLLALTGMYFREHNNGLVYGFWRARETAAADSFGPFVNRNHFAGWMLMATGLAIGLLCGRLERTLKRLQPSFQRRLDWLSSSGAAAIAGMIIGILVMATSLVWTMSRSGILSFVVAIGCFAFLMIRRQNGSRAQRSFGVALLSVVLLAGLSWRGFGRLTLWFGDTRDFEGRLGAWNDGWQVVRDFPLTGTGINTWGLDMLFYQRHNLEWWMSHAHNDYLQLLAEGGLLVSIPVVLAVVLFAVAVRRRMQHARQESEVYWLRAGACIGLIAMGVQEAVEFSLHIPANMFLFATLAAIALSPIAAPPDVAPSSTPRN